MDKFVIDNSIMDDLVADLLRIEKNSPNNETIGKNMKPFLNKLEEKFGQQMMEYYEKRKEYNKNLMQFALEKIKFLEKIFEKKIQAEFVLSDSLKSGINLMYESDIDITMIVDDYTSEFVENTKSILTNIGFKYRGLINDYHLFYQKIPEVELEIKLRKCDQKTKSIIQLHNLMEELSDREKMIITFGKLIFHGTPYYNTFKMQIYNMYFVRIPGYHILK